MRDNKRGTIEDPSTDRVLALAFEQEKQERLLDETAHSVRVSEELAKEIPPLGGMTLADLFAEVVVLARRNEIEDTLASDLLNTALRFGASEEQVSEWQELLR